MICLRFAQLSDEGLGRKSACFYALIYLIFVHSQYNLYEKIEVRKK